MKTLLKNCYILIREENNYKVLENAYLGYEDDKIIYVSENPPTDNYLYQIDMSGKLIMPGLINAHGHASMSLLRSVGEGLPLDKWLFDAIFPIEDKMTPEDIENGILLSALEMISSGTTTFSDMYFCTYRAFEAFAKTGLRGDITLVGLINKPNETVSDSVRYKEIVNLLKYFESNFTITNPTIAYNLGKDTFSEETIKAINSGLLKYVFSYHSEYLCNEEMTQAYSKLNKDRNLPIQLHASETKRETENCYKKYGCSPIEFFYKNGGFKYGNIYAAHCVHVDDNDLKIMRDNNVSMVHCPSSNLKLGSGIAPVVEAIKAGVNVALGTDGCASNNNLDMFEEMHIAALLQSGVHSDACAISVKDVLDMATINGAKAMGRNDIGQIKVGYKADLIAIDLNSPNLQPLNDIVSSLVYSVSSHNVCMTIVNGKTLYENGKFFTLNPDEIYKKVRQSVKTLQINK